jgi:hypothetical protein
MPTVTGARKEMSSDGTHQHIEGVCTTAGMHYTRAQVVAGIDRGEDWHTYAGGKTAKIRKLIYCSAPGCFATPYITTAPDHTSQNNLDHLAPC